MKLTDEQSEQIRGAVELYRDSVAAKVELRAISENNREAAQLVKLLRDVAARLHVSRIPARLEPMLDAELQARGIDRPDTFLAALRGTERQLRAGVIQLREAAAAVLTRSKQKRRGKPSNEAQKLLMATLWRALGDAGLRGAQRRDAITRVLRAHRIKLSGSVETAIREAVRKAPATPKN